MTTDHEALIREARELSSWLEPSEITVQSMLDRLADALGAASVERAVVEAQALEQAAELIAERYAATQVRHESGYEEGYSDALDWAECEILARAVEIREGRQ